MDNHPIPQDVTGFQFRLIGNLTIKQFAYIGASAVLCVVVWYLPAVHPVIKTILLFLIGGTGPALAFLPIEGRPLDQMAGHFVKALMTPNQYLYHKTGGKLPLSTVELHKIKQLTAKEVEEKKAEKQQVMQKEQKLELYLNQLHQVQTPIDQREAAFMQAVLSGKPISPQQQAVLGPAPATQRVTVTPEPQAPTVIPQAPTPSEAQQKTAQTQEPIRQGQDTDGGQTQKLQELMQQKAHLEQEMMRLSQQPATPEKPATPSATSVSTPPSTPQMQATAAPATEEALSSGARKVPNDQASQVGIPTLPGIPNLIFGIVKDPRGNVLSGILVEVKDKDGNPVRAFKTNGLGQFAAATALQNGTYTILFEDPKGQHKFDIVELEIRGEVIQPIEIVSHDAREELRKSLFG